MSMPEQAYMSGVHGLSCICPAGGVPSQRSQKVRFGPSHSHSSTAIQDASKRATGLAALTLAAKRLSQLQHGRTNSMQRPGPPSARQLLLGPVDEESGHSTAASTSQSSPLTAMSAALSPELPALTTSTTRHQEQPSMQRMPPSSARDALAQEAGGAASTAAAAQGRLEAASILDQDIHRSGTSIDFMITLSEQEPDVDGQACDRLLRSLLSDAEPGMVGDLDGRASRACQTWASTDALDALLPWASPGPKVSSLK